MFGWRKEEEWLAYYLWFCVKNGSQVSEQGKKHNRERTYHQVRRYREDTKTKEITRTCSLSTIFIVNNPSWSLSFLTDNSSPPDSTSEETRRSQGTIDKQRHIDSRGLKECIREISIDFAAQKKTSHQKHLLLNLVGKKIKILHCA